MGKSGRRHCRSRIYARAFGLCSLYRPRLSMRCASVARPQQPAATLGFSSINRGTTPTAREGAGSLSLFNHRPSKLSRRQPMRHENEEVPPMRLPPGLGCSMRLKLDFVPPAERRRRSSTSRVCCSITHGPTLRSRASWAAGTLTQCSYEARQLQETLGGFIKKCEELIAGTGHPNAL